MRSNTLQRLEGLAIFIASTVLYFYAGFEWWIFLLLILAVDVSMVGYLVNPRIGAVVYNIGHSLIAPSALAVFAIAVGSDIALATSLIWLAHIGMDRAFGFGLKLPTGFKHTHLGDIGH